MRGTAEGGAWDDDDWKFAAADAAPPHNKQIKAQETTLATKPVV